MIRTLSILFVFALSHGAILGKAFHVYSPSSKTNTLWIVKATPKGDSLMLEVSEKVELDFSGRVITAHPSKPLLYVTATGGDPGKVPGAVVFLNKDGLPIGGVEVEVSNPTETQSVQVKGQRAMLAEKKSKADWY